MPKQCPHCLKKWVWTTYELIRHVEKCPKTKSVTVYVDKNKFNTNKNIALKTDFFSSNKKK